MTHPKVVWGQICVYNFRFSVDFFTAVVDSGHEEVRPPDSKRFQTEMDEITARIRDFETKLVSKQLVAVIFKWVVLVWKTLRYKLV